MSTADYMEIGFLSRFGDSEDILVGFISGNMREYNV